MCNCEAHIDIGITSEFKGIKDLIERIFKGVLKRGDVSTALFESTASTLFDAVETGYGKKLIDLDYNTPDARMIRQLRENVYVFCAFKTYQELRTMTDNLIDENGKLRSFDSFKKKALELHADYDIRFLNAEYQHAETSGRMAALWKQIEEDGDEYNLLYDAILDSGTTSICRQLDGTILPPSHEFWKTFALPNHWGERSVIRQTTREANKAPKVSAGDLKPMFRNNVGITGVVFPESHPYFTVAKADQEKAKNLFGLKIPKK